VGLDLYAGPVSRYVAGDWKTIVQQAGEASGNPVIIVRRNPAEHPVTDADVPMVIDAVAKWRARLIASLGLAEEWQEDPADDYYTDKPDWDGYGAAVLLAAYDEQPHLAPGTQIRRLLGRTTVAAVEPRRFQEAPAFKAAIKSPARYPTLLLGAQWCLPLAGGPAVFKTLTPSGAELVMGRVAGLVEELNTLNQRTLRLSPEQLKAAAKAGPPGVDAPVEAMAPFGLAVLTATAEFAANHHAAWIMDY
jgi:hypothetical protein